MNVKKLIWVNNITKIGQENGYIHEIGKFPINAARDTFIKYDISNSFAGLKPMSEIMVFDPFEDTKLASFENIEEAKEYAQKHFENYIKETFFENV